MGLLAIIFVGIVVGTVVFVKFTSTSVSTDPEDRRHLMSAPATKWYRDQVESIEDLVSDSPIVEVFFHSRDVNQ